MMTLCRLSRVSIYAYYICESELTGPIQAAAPVNAPFITPGGSYNRGDKGRLDLGHRDMTERRVRVREVISTPGF